MSNYIAQSGFFALFYLARTFLLFGSFFLISRLQRKRKPYLTKGSCLILRGQAGTAAGPFVEQLKIKETSKDGKYALRSISMGDRTNFGWRSMPEIEKELQGTQLISGNLPIKR